MTVFMWIDPQSCAEYELLRVKSIDDESMVLKIQGKQLKVISSTVGKILDMQIASFNRR